MDNSWLSNQHLYEDDLEYSLLGEHHDHSPILTYRPPGFIHEGIPSAYTNPNIFESADTQVNDTRLSQHYHTSSDHEAHNERYVNGRKHNFIHGNIASPTLVGTGPILNSSISRPVSKRSKPKMQAQHDTVASSTRKAHLETPVKKSTISRKTTKKETRIATTTTLNQMELNAPFHQIKESMLAPKGSYKVKKAPVIAQTPDKRLAVRCSDLPADKPCWALAILHGDAYALAIEKREDIDDPPEACCSPFPDQYLGDSASSFVEGWSDTDEDSQHHRMRTFKPHITKCGLIVLTYNQEKKRLEVIRPSKSVPIVVNPMATGQEIYDLERKDPGLCRKDVQDRMYGVSRYRVQRKVKASLKQEGSIMAKDQKGH